MRTKLFFAVSLFILLFISCKNERLQAPAEALPVVQTKMISAITSFGATTGGEISSEGNTAVIERGVCYGTTAAPTISNSKISNGTGAGNYESILTGLAANTTYYVRAYATNTAGTAYGNEVSFTTSTGTPNVGLPVLTTANVSYNAANNTAQTGGNISSGGSSAITAKGVCWSTSVNPTIANSKTTDGSGTGNFSSTITGLAPNTAYYVRAYATNGAGTAYGDHHIFSTTTGGGGGGGTPGLPTLTTTAATFNSATNQVATGGNITADGGSAVTARGVCWSTNPSPTIAGSKTTDGTGTGIFSSAISGLTANNSYYIRAYATNAAGTIYGNQITVSTAVNNSPFTIGQTYGGGIIFYIDASGQHGLIAALQDLGSAAGTRWDYRSNTTLLGANSNTDGKANTNTIVAALGNTQTYAAALCKNYNGGGFTDWYLPSKNELDLLFAKRNEVGGFNLSSGEYWSSTEANKDKAWMQEFKSGSNSGRQDDDNKDDGLLVRAIRSF